MLKRHDDLVYFLADFRTHSTKIGVFLNQNALLPNRYHPLLSHQPKVQPAGHAQNKRLFCLFIPRSFVSLHHGY